MTTFGAFKCVLALSLLIPCHTQLPLQQGSGGSEEDGGVDGGCTEITAKRNVTIGACTEVNTHVCHFHTYKRMVVAKSLYTQLQEEVRWLKFAGERQLSGINPFCVPNNHTNIDE